jgi:aminoglycoside phosphotransferase (APT) family kinase protein
MHPEQPLQESVAPEPLHPGHPVQLALVDLGLGGLTDDGLESRHGRNANWLGSTPAGRRLFVKRLSGPGGPERLRRESAFAALLDRVGPVGLPVPDLVGVDTERLVTVSVAAEDTHTVAHDLAAWQVEPALFSRLGRILATLHALPVDEAEAAGLRPEPVIEPDVRHFGAIPFDLAAGMSAGMLDFYRLLQHDAEIVAPFTRLHEVGPYGPAVVHADMRVDQVLIGPDGGLTVVDWEECRIGDPARDLGALVGDVLYATMVSLRRDDEATGTDLEQVTAQAARRLRDDGLPLVHALHEGYLDAGGRRGPEFAAQTMRAAGWQLFDRALARAQSHIAFATRDRAAAGIGRRMLLDPAAAARALEWGADDRPTVPDAAAADPAPAGDPAGSATAEPALEAVR